MFKKNRAVFKEFTRKIYIHESTSCDGPNTYYAYVRPDEFNSSILWSMRLKKSPKVDPLNYSFSSEGTIQLDEENEPINLIISDETIEILYKTELPTISILKNKNHLDASPSLFKVDQNSKIQFENILEDDERFMWHGLPGNFQFFWLLFFVFFSMGIILYMSYFWLGLSYIAMTSDENINLKFMMSFFFVAGFAMFFYCLKTALKFCVQTIKSKQRMQYFVTDRRVLILELLKNSTALLVRGNFNAADLYFSTFEQGKKRISINFITHTDGYGGLFDLPNDCGILPYLENILVNLNFDNIGKQDN